ncbi:hypothetical protein OIU78_007135 [Salix suchowensis]|nr:hypothetical protein OIU78_007135 [Salix suchowensis]
MHSSCQLTSSFMFAFTNDNIEPLVSYALDAVCTLNKDKNEIFNLIL